MKLLIILTLFMNLSLASDDAFKAGFEFYDLSSNNYKLPDSKGVMCNKKISYLS